MHFHHATVTRRDPDRPIETEDKLRQAESLTQRNDRIQRWISAFRVMPNQSNVVHSAGNDKYAKDDVQPFITVDDVHDLLRETASEKILKACRGVESAASSLESEIGDAVGEIYALRDELDPNVKTDENGARIPNNDGARLDALLAVFDWFHNDMKHTGAWRHCTDNLCRLLGETAGER